MNQEVMIPQKAKRRKMNKEEFNRFISGFVAGEGFFYIAKTSKKINGAKFGIKLDIKDKDILLKIKKHLDCGTINYPTYDGRKQILFLVGKNKDLREKIIPFFENNSMYPAEKQIIFQKWSLIVDMIYKKEHLIDKNKDLIRLLSNNLNINGKSNGNQYTKKRGSKCT